MKKRITTLLITVMCVMMLGGCKASNSSEVKEVVSYGTPQEVITPELIHNLYEVESSVNMNEEGILHVIFRPTRPKGECK